MSNLRQLLVNEAEQHIDGPLPVRVVCPVCLGGSDHEECQTIWEGDDGNIFTKCHRSTCEAGTYLVKGSLQAGLILDNHEGARRELAAPQPHAKVVERCSNLDPSGKVAERMREDYAFNFFAPTPYFPVTNFIKNYRGGIALPMYDSTDAVRGVIVKPMNPDLPKSLTYKDPDYNGLSWYLTGDHLKDSSVLVVEDGLSAVACMMTGHSAVALNGTLLNMDRVRAIARHKRVLYLCFDADATTKAVEYAIKFGSYTPIKVARLTKDYKNVPNNELQFVLKELKGSG